MYSKITKEEDDRVAERWQKDADGILIFVSLHNTTHEHKLGIILDWFILRSSRRTTCRIRPGPQTEFSRYFRILPRKYLSGSCRPKRYSSIFSCRTTSSVLSSDTCCLGEFTLVPELGH